MARTHAVFLQRSRSAGHSAPPERAAVFDEEALSAWFGGDPFGCFGTGFERAASHVRTPAPSPGTPRYLRRITVLDPGGGRWNHGLLRADLALGARPIEGGSGAAEAALLEAGRQALAFYLAALGLTVEHDGWRFEISPELPGTRWPGRGAPPVEAGRVACELHVEALQASSRPAVRAELSVYRDSTPVFHAHPLEVRLVLDHPFDPEWRAPEPAPGARPALVVDGHAYDHRAVTAIALGPPSAGWGPLYRPLDAAGICPRLPASPYSFVHRVVGLTGRPGTLGAGAILESEYDVPAAAWYFDEGGQGTMPLAVLLEVALQPCGILVGLTGAPVRAAERLFFRNLDGVLHVHRRVGPGAGILRVRATLARVSTSSGMVLYAFAIACSLGDDPVLDLDTGFGFFPAASLAQQVGLGAAHGPPDRPRADPDLVVDLADPAGPFTSDRPRLAGGGLRLLDRASWWAQATPEGHARVEGTYRVDPGAWFFRAHFHQDPVQPGSLGLEAMVQLLKVHALAAGLDKELPDTRFEAPDPRAELSWTYRGQVRPESRQVRVIVEITEVCREEEHTEIRGTGWLYVDGTLIYRAAGLALRLFGTRPTAWETRLDPEVDTWLFDHRPTHSVPVMPMMGVADLLARGAGHPVACIRRLRLRRWLRFDRAHRLRVRASRGRAVLEVLGEDGSEEVAAAMLAEFPGPRPAPLPPIHTEAVPLPYETGAMFHGPAFHLLVEHHLGSEGAWGRLDPSRSGVPVGALDPGLLDAALHVVPHDEPARWWPDLPPGVVAYPYDLEVLEMWGPAPTRGEIRAEARPDGDAGLPGLPRVLVQILADGRVWAQFRLVLVTLPMGFLTRLPRLHRAAFLDRRAHVPGLALFDAGDGTTRVPEGEITALSWLEGTVEHVYGTADPSEIALKEHVASRVGIHPRHLPEALPFNEPAATVRCEDGIAVASGEAPGPLDIARMRARWVRRYGANPVLDALAALTAKFVRRVVLSDPPALAALKDRSILYLGNHQTRIESALLHFTIGALGEHPLLSVAKLVNRTTLVSFFDQLGREWPGVQAPPMIVYLDPDDRTAQLDLFRGLAAVAATSSLMVHVEGTRAVSARQPLERMSSALCDLAVGADLPIVPFRLAGGLPVEAAGRFEAPIGMGSQDYWFGAPLLPEDIARFPYAERRQQVMHAIDTLGPGCANERPNPPDPAFAAEVRALQRDLGLAETPAVFVAAMRTLPELHPALRALLQGLERGCPPWTGDPPTDRWLAEATRFLLGTDPPG